VKVQLQDQETEAAIYRAAQARLQVPPTALPAARPSWADRPALPLRSHALLSLRSHEPPPFSFFLAHEEDQYDGICGGSIWCCSVATVMVSTVALPAIFFSAGSHVMHSVPPLGPRFVPASLTMSAVGKRRLQKEYAELAKAPPRQLVLRPWMPLDE
jgi:hypothetical protein